MIQFEKFQLENGLKLITHKDTSSPMVAINVLYNVGAKNEDPDKTGFAHLFEHLMFGGSINIANYDEPLQIAGGENNAYTTNDLTNYYLQLPKENIETGLWLESDRMLSLAFNKESLDVQRKVVSEEFKENYINKPYGDASALLRKLAYKEHPYQWLTIGKELNHIEDATLEDVKAFFKKYYVPNNAIICIAGNIDPLAAFELVKKWFGDIPKGADNVENIKTEPIQQKAAVQTVQRDVPVNAIYKAWHVEGRLSDNYYAADILSEILGSGRSSRLYNSLIKEQQLFSNIECYNTGSTDPGLIIISGKLMEGIDPEAANLAIETELEHIKQKLIEQEELEKTINRIESLVQFEDMSILSRANNLAYYELIGDAALINNELERYQKLSREQLKDYANKIFVQENSSTLYYLKN